MLARPTILFLAAALGSAGSSFGEEPWREILARDGVRVAARRMPGSKIEEVRASAVLPVAAGPLFAVLADVEAYPVIMPPTVVARPLRREASSTIYYMVIDPPWISRRDYCIRVTQDRLPDGKLRSGWEIAGEECPPPTGSMIRVRENRGRWLLTPTPDGRATLVEYQAHTDPGGAVPAWIVNRASARQLPDILAALRRAALSPPYDRAR